MDSGKCQTSTASPAEPGDLPALLVATTRSHITYPRKLGLSPIITGGCKADRSRENTNDLIPQCAYSSLLSALSLYNSLAASAYFVQDDIGSGFPDERLGFLVPVSQPLVDGLFEFSDAKE